MTRFSTHDDSHNALSTEAPAQNPSARELNSDHAPLRHVRVAILGAGFSGLGMAIRLKQRGYRDFVVLERAADVGGTWRDNTYPGCACGVQSHLYSYSFALNPTWSHTFSGQQEIWEYLRTCTERFGLQPFMRWISAPVQREQVRI